MGRKSDLKETEKQEITKLLHNGKDTLKILKRDHRTIQSFCNEGKKCRKKRNQRPFAKISDRDLCKIKSEDRNTPCASSKSIFESAGMPKCVEQQDVKS